MIDPEAGWCCSCLGFKRPGINPAFCFLEGRALPAPAALAVVLEGRVPSRPFGFGLLRLRGLDEVGEVELAPP